jgi:hypothetical protein
MRNKSSAMFLNRQKYFMSHKHGCFLSMEVYIPSIIQRAGSDRTSDLILSMGPSNIETLRGQTITLERMTKPETGPVMLQIRLIDFEGKQYCLPKQRCQTWFVSQPIHPSCLAKLAYALS